ncbi:hypothetical protein B0J11DRAFT_516867 [Dendryphion nanum]|uniref:Zn(2)-C6 fungal-type domain-containing protein n=1 Tax=Dendryphion nanum TaxID=256645 RepID=A0A9P9ELV7_9PLEO|nr:hypothetical protein B0J11DRAFT_516867 [Dendryphion nanum]
MPKLATQKRTQFSSCDACRRSRVACDASKHRRQLDRSKRSESCSRCSAKKRPCTFEWMKHAKGDPLNVAQTVTPPPSTSTIPEPSHLEQTHISRFSAPQAEQFQTFTLQKKPLDPLMAKWCDRFFRNGFEAVFGTMVGRYGCPMIDDMGAKINIPSRQLVNTLDTYLKGNSENENVAPAVQNQDQKHLKDAQLDQFLDSTIRAYTARWLSLTSQTHGYETMEIEHFIRQSWRKARRNMHRLVNRVSYRSILALYLFSQTPTPIGITEEEEQDGISRALCLQSIYMQIQELRQRHNRQFSYANEELIISFSEPGKDIAQTYIDLETRAYWAVVMWDTSNSLTSSCRTSFTSGLKGACSEPTWKIVFSYLVISVKINDGACWKKDVEMTEENASRIISAAEICKLYIWKNIASLKEALREGVEEQEVLEVWHQLVCGLMIFKSPIRTLLGRCERRLQFLDQSIKLRWYMVSLQYHLGILMLAEILENTGRIELLKKQLELVKDTDHECFNVLKFGLENTYTICLATDSKSVTVSAKDATTTGVLQRPITVCLIACDPFPHYVVRIVQLMHRSMDRGMYQWDWNVNSLCDLSSILEEALGVLPQDSKDVQAGRMYFNNRAFQQQRRR